MLCRQREKKAPFWRGARLLTGALCFALVSGVLATGHEAQALRVSMKRIVFEGPKRSDIITIMNNTAEEQTYRLGWRHYRMDETKSLVRIDDGALDSAAGNIKWADDMIRFAPRRVTVPPGGSQQVRVLLRRPRDLAPGEYRSHLWIVTEASAKAFVPDEEKAPEGQQSFRLSMLPALTLPVFVRHGDLQASASITEAKLSKTAKGASVSFILNREGNRSLYGDMNIICTGSGEEYVAAQTRGIAVYTDVSRRILDFNFTYPPEKAAACAKLRIEYSAEKDDPLFQGGIIAQTSL